MGEREEWKEKEELVGLFRICCHHSLGRGLWWTGKLQRGPGLFLLCHSVCGGRETWLSIAGYKVLPVSQRPLPAARMWGAG